MVFTTTFYIIYPQTDVEAFDEINTVSEYLNTYGVTVAERIKNQFTPLFGPAAEKLSPEIFFVNDSIRLMAGYNLYDAAGRSRIAETMHWKKQVLPLHSGMLLRQDKNRFNGVTRLPAENR